VSLGDGDTVFTEPGVWGNGDLPFTKMTKMPVVVSEIPKGQKRKAEKNHKISFFS
jgi:hypothetical protein